jgi:hypothetical protein
MQPNGAPTPDNANIPLLQGIDADWNDVIKYIPEDKRAEAGQHLATRVAKYKETEAAYEPWKEFSGSGVDPQYAQQALLVLDALENRPQEVYELLQKHLGLTPQQAAQVVNQQQQTQQTTEEPEFDFSAHPEFQAMKRQLDAASQILLARRNEEQQMVERAQADQALEDDINALKSKVGNNIPEREILMRMAYGGSDGNTLSAEEAYADYMESVKNIQKYRPSPLVMGGGGPIPTSPIDVKKLDSAGTKSLVVQMLENAANQ